MEISKTYIEKLLNS